MTWERRGAASWRALTPVQRLRQADPSWLRSGQTTTLFSSDTEKDPVSEARGGIAASIYPRAEPSAVGAAAGRLSAVNGGQGAGGSFRELGRRRPELWAGAAQATVRTAGEGGLAGQSSYRSLRRAMRGFRG
jgi:hypothetical protein